MSRGRCEDAVICAHLDGCLVHIIGQQADVAERVVFTFPRGADNKQSAMSLRSRNRSIAPYAAGWEGKSPAATMTASGTGVIGCLCVKFMKMSVKNGANVRYYLDSKGKVLTFAVLFHCRNYTCISK